MAWILSRILFVIIPLTSLVVQCSASSIKDENDIRSDKNISYLRSTSKDNDDGGWYDCSEEVGITDPLLSFVSIRSDPTIVTPQSEQTIFKIIRYDKTSNSGDHTLTAITADFHQYYKVFGKYWMTFLIVHNIDQCKEHETFCPLSPGNEVQVVTVHPPLSSMTPKGWYRSRQVYKDAETGTKIGCVDMSFLFSSEEFTSLNIAKK